MKTHKHTFRFVLPLLAALALPTAGVRAADDVMIENFDIADDTAGWARWWGAAVQTYEWDSSMDASNNAASGSLKVSVDFNLATHGGDNQFAVIGSFTQVDASQYTNLVFDLRWDPSSPQANGNFGFLEPGLRVNGFGQSWLPGFSVSTNPGWMRVSLPIDPTAVNLDTANGVVLKMWSGGGSGFTGKAIFWVDNVQLIARPNVELPPPSLTLEKAAQGLQVFASASGAQYQRQSIKTVTGGYGWVGAAAPVTYSLTMGAYPGGAYPGFQTHLFLAQGSGIPASENSPDWNRANVVFLHLQNNADGSAFAAFRHKTNQPSGNGMLFGSGMLAGLGAPRIQGTWNLTFNPDGVISLTAPHGAVTNFSMPAESAALFAGDVYAYFGVQPNQLGNIGQSGTFTSVRISGVPNPINETFAAAPLDPAVWEISAENPPGVVVVPAQARFWLNWTLPDNGFSVQASESLGADEFWFAVSPLTIGPIRGIKRTLLFDSHLEGFEGRHFFRLIKGTP